MRPHVLLPLLALACAPKVPAELPKATHTLGTTERTTVVMPDGVGLDTTYRLPDGAGPFPVVVFRYPYALRGAMQKRCVTWVERGYACVHQFTRGQGKSEGEWVPFENERADGLATLDWLREQPWQDGHWALIGESYLAATAWIMADALPPEVKTMVLSVFGTDYYDALYADGLFRHDIGTAWATLMPTRGTRIFAGKRYKRALKVRPQAEADLTFYGQVLPWYRAWVGSPVPGEGYWQSPWMADVQGLAERVDIPVYMVAGWSDAFLGPQLTTWETLASQDRSVLFVGPWNHLGRAKGDIPLEGANAFPLPMDTFRWVGHHLKGEGSVREFEGRAIVYTVGTETWRYHDSWPGPTEPLRFYPQGNGSACGGQLTDAPSEGTTQWTYSPDDPFRGQGGAGLFAGSLPIFPGTPEGFIDPGPSCRRLDVKGFVSDPLPDDLHLAGRMTAQVRLTTDVPDTSVVVRWVSEQPDGTAVLLRDAFTTLSFHGKTGGDDPVDVTLQSWPLDVKLPAGSRVRMEITSSNFPKVAAHPNTTTPWALETTPQVAHVEVDLAHTWMALPRKLSEDGSVVPTEAREEP